MTVSRNRKIKTKPPTPSVIESFNDVLLALLAEYPADTRYIGWAFAPCRRCRASAYALRATSNDGLLLLFCKTCFWTCADSTSPAFIRAVKNFDRNAADLYHNPDRPLERSIKKHLRQLKPPNS